MFTLANVFIFSEPLPRRYIERNDALHGHIPSEVGNLVNLLDLYVLHNLLSILRAVFSLPRRLHGS